MGKAIIIYDVEYPDPNFEDWKPERVPELIFTEGQYKTFVRGYTPDWECRYAPCQYKEWLYIIRSGHWLKKFRFEKQNDGFFHLAEHYTTEKEAGRNLIQEILIKGYYGAPLEKVGYKYSFNCGDELTAKMHYEFLADLGVDKKDFFIFAASGDIKRGIPKEEALKMYDLTEKEYDENIERVLNDISW